MAMSGLGYTFMARARLNRATRFKQSHWRLSLDLERLRNRSTAEIDESEAELDSLGSERDELGQWLDQLQTLTKELDSVRPNMQQQQQPNSPRKQKSQGPSMHIASPRASSVAATPKHSFPAVASGACASPQHAAPSDAVVAPRKKPAVPPKPPIDTYRYSMVNMQESPEVDLDALLSELCELESQLNHPGNTGFMFAAPSAASHKDMYRAQPGKSTSCTTGVPAEGHLVSVSPRCPAVPSSRAHAHRMSAADSGISVTTTSSQVTDVRTHSPDNDSAFGDSASMFSGESAPSCSNRSRDSNASSSGEGSRGFVTTPSPTQLSDVAQLKTAQQQHDGTTATSGAVRNELASGQLTEAERIKAEKIKLALEKMKEANVKKLFVKVFTADGGSRSILVDERWTVAYILRLLAEKHQMPLTPRHAIVEEYPELHMERIYEDHEHLVENIMLWTRDSPNKLWFVERPDKCELFENPQDFLLSSAASDNAAKALALDSARKQQLIEEFFNPSHVPQPPELEGFLWLKADGKKAWKRHYVVLRASGLYYIPKGKSKNSKDLVCLMQLEMVQTYVGFGWKKKYKAPTEFGFALKIQVKASKYIKYLCAEDAHTLQKWVIGLRIAKSGQQLYDNFEDMRKYLDHEGQSQTPSLKSSLSVDSCCASQQPSEMAEYYKENVVVRPKSALHVPQTSMLMQQQQVDRSPTTPNGGAFISEQHEVVVMRPRSADIRSAGSGGKRSSRGTLTAVDLPSIPDEVAGGSALPVQPPTQMNGHAHHDTQSLNSSSGSGGSMGSLTFRGSADVSGNGVAGHSSSDAGSVNAFEADVCGTIKRRPPIPGGPGWFAAPANAKLPLTDTTKHIHVHLAAASRNSETSLTSSSTGISGGGSTPSLSNPVTPDGSGCAGYIETDSDEELNLPPPPPEFLAPPVEPHAQRLSGSGFPAPPSPVALHQHSVPPPLTVLNEGNAPCGNRHLPGQTNGHATLAECSNYANNQLSMHVERLPNGHCQSGTGSDTDSVTFSKPQVNGLTLAPPTNGLSSSASSPRQVPLVSPGSGGAKNRPPPPPPKRSENTRLTNTQTGQIAAAVERGSLMPAAVQKPPVPPPSPPVIVNPMNSAPPPDMKKFKQPPAVPAKPPKPVMANGNGAAGGVTTNAFLNDLQAAMQRRQKTAQE